MDKQRYEYYKGSTAIIDNETDEYVEDVVDVLNQKDFNINELLKTKQLQAKQIVDLEAKLAESEKERQMWQEMYKNADRQNKTICETDIYPLQEEIQQLKQQLADALKDFNDIQEENDKLAQQLQEEKNRSKKLNHEAQKYYEDAYCNGSQNEKAIAELEKVKEFIREFVGINDVKFICTTTITDQLDQQIAELKGEK